MEDKKTRNILTENEGEVRKEEEAEKEEGRTITRTCLRAEATARWAGTCLRSKAATARQARRLGREREQDLDVR